MDKKDVQKIANLARVELSDAELELFGRQFSDILKYIQQLDRVDIQGIEPVSHPFNIKNVFREDEIVLSGDFPQKFLAIAPDSAKGMVKVPAVIESK